MGLDDDHVAKNTYEFKRAREIERVLRDFREREPDVKNPMSAFDLHETIRKSPALALKTVSPVAVNPDTMRLMRAMQIGNLILRDGATKDPTTIRTFEDMLFEQYRADSQTLELGQIGASENVGKFVKDALIRIIEGRDLEVATDAPEVKTWMTVDSPVKHTSGFTFADPHLVNFSELCTGKNPYATDGNLGYFAGNESRIIFPNPGVEIGERAGVVIVPFRT
jgi:succinylglutamate desuccinylase